MFVFNGSLEQDILYTVESFEFVGQFSWIGGGLVIRGDVISWMHQFSVLEIKITLSN